MLVCYLVVVMVMCSVLWTGDTEPVVSRNPLINHSLHGASFHETTPVVPRGFTVVSKVLHSCCHGTTLNCRVTTPSFH